jgi:hypothetical protein
LPSFASTTEALETDTAAVTRFERRLPETREAVPPMWNVRIVSCVPAR